MHKRKKGKLLLNTLPKDGLNLRVKKQLNLQLQNLITHKLKQVKRVNFMMFYGILNTYLGNKIFYD